MKNLLALVLLAACAGTDNPDLFPEADGGTGDAGAEVELGQTAQALTVPDYYGIAAGTDGTKCAPGDGVDCYVPFDKNIKVKFYASTCSSWWQARLVHAETLFSAQMVNRGWSYTSGSATPTVRFRCSTDATKCPGRYGCTTFTGVTCSGGTCKYTGADVWIKAVDIEAQGNWAIWTETQRQKTAFNIWTHEFGHGMGLGHDFLFGDPNVVEANRRYSAMTDNFKQDKWQVLDESWQRPRLENYVP